MLGLCVWYSSSGVRLAWFVARLYELCRMGNRVTSYLVMTSYQVMDDSLAFRLTA
jgi:hypothetical protein